MFEFIIGTILYTVVIVFVSYNVGRFHQALHDDFKIMNNIEDWVKEHKRDCNAISEVSSNRVG